MLTYVCRQAQEPEGGLERGAMGTERSGCDSRQYPDDLPAVCLEVCLSPSSLPPFLPLSLPPSLPPSSSLSLSLALSLSCVQSVYPSPAHTHTNNKKASTHTRLNTRAHTHTPCFERYWLNRHCGFKVRMETDGSQLDRLYKLGYVWQHANTANCMQDFQRRFAWCTVTYKSPLKVLVMLESSKVLESSIPHVRC
jgi:hypothetical protein